MKNQDMENQVGKSQEKQDNTGKGFGVSGQNPGKKEGPVSNDATNTRGENVSSQQDKDASNSDSPQGSDAYDTSTRGADSSDKEFRNNQPNASTLMDQKGKKDSQNEK